MTVIILLLIILLLICTILYMRARHIKMLDGIDSMIDAAADGSFEESEFNESRLSKTEAKMYRYLSIGRTSLKQINSEKNEIKSLISDISHQTKTPLANILLYSELLCDGANENAGELAQHIKTQTEKLSFLIGSLIKLSRLENGIVSLNPKENSIDCLLSGLDFENKAENKSIDLKIEKNSDLTAVFDMKWTGEAIANIVDNAIKYTQCGGTVSVAAASYEMFVKIDITDNGIGINEEEYSKVFSRFYRSQRVNDEKGVGIGLYLSREIISRQGGYIMVKSKENVGSTFSVFLPKNPNVSKL